MARHSTFAIGEISLSSHETQAPFLSVVVPAYNEATHLAANLDRIARFLDENSWTYEVLVVDDGSTDQTGDAISSRPSPAVRLLSHETKLGKGAAVRTGLTAATGTWVLITDADLSTPIEEVEKLLSVGAGADLVFGSRALPESRVELPQSLCRERLGRFFNWFVRSAGLTTLRDTQCGFKLIRGEVGRSLSRSLKIRGYAFDVELQWEAVRAGYRVQEVGVVWRNSNRSAVRPWVDGIRMVFDCLRIRLGVTR